MLLPDQTTASGTVKHLAVAAGKDNNIYVVDRDSMGKFSPTANNIWQELIGTLAGGIWGSPAYYNGVVYYGGLNDNLKALPVSGAFLATTAASKSPETFVYPGATPAVSANGTSNGIVWAAENGTVGALHAYNAGKLASELYNSNQAGTRDQWGAGNTFITPMIARGKVYVGATNGVAVFGLLCVRRSVYTASRQVGRLLRVTRSRCLTRTAAAWRSFASGLLCRRGCLFRCGRRRFRRRCDFRYVIDASRRSLLCFLRGRLARCALFTALGLRAARIRLVRAA